VLLNSENRTEIDGCYNNKSHKKNPMNSLSTKDDGRRTSPRKSAGQMPHYLARESNEEKVGKGVKKLGRGVNKRAVEEESELSSSSVSVRSIQPRKKLRRITVEEKGVKGAKKLGVGLNKRMAAMKQSESSSYDDLQRGRRHRSMRVMTSPPQVMILILHTIQGRESTR
jgi:hypothetical protein